jgi:hypothetical protein
VNSQPRDDYGKKKSGVPLKDHPIEDQGKDTEFPMERFLEMIMLKNYVFSETPV